MYKVVPTKVIGPAELNMLLNELGAKGWFPLFPMWNGEAIVFHQSEVDVLAAQELAEYEANAAEEKLREP